MRLVKTRDLGIKLDLYERERCNKSVTFDINLNLGRQTLKTRLTVLS